ncbi:MAG: hypothetical protein ACF8TS_22725 [Maioricimonas sp. JB049]
MTRVVAVFLFSLAAVSGCDRGPRRGSSDAIESHRVAGALVLDPTPDNPQIERFTDHLASLGYRLRYAADRSEWQSAAPVVGKYGMRLSIGAFPPDSSLQEMQRSLMATNLAYGLNPDAHLAMSEPGLVRMEPDGDDHGELMDTLESEAFRTARDELKRAFLDYRPAFVQARTSP